MSEQEFTYEESEIIAGYAVRFIEDYRIPLFEAIETAKNDYRKLKNLENKKMFLIVY